MLWHIKVFAILLLVFERLTRLLAQNVPLNPCPKMFQYRFDGNEWFGVLSIRQPIAEQDLQLKVTLSLRGKPINSYLGEIELLTRGKFESDVPLLYKIKFPHSAQPPKLLQISVNNQIICLGLPYQGMFVTQIQLEHLKKKRYVAKDDEEDNEDDDIPAETIEENTKTETQDNHMRMGKDFCGVIDKRIGFHFGNISANPFTSSGATDNIKKTVPPVITSDDIIPMPDSRGATPIPRGAWPWLAAIYVNNLTSLAYQCVGTLISSRIVISAAHCFHMLHKQYNANELLIFLGRHNLKNWNEEQSVAAPVDEIFLHPQFNANLNNYDADIAVIVLKHEVKFNTFIRPACLWTGPTDLQYVQGENGFVVGWNLGHGNITETSIKSTVPKIMNAPLVSNEDCFKSSEKLSSISSNRTFCAGRVTIENAKSSITMGTTPCRGDSGAGLFIFKNNRWMLRGTVSASLPAEGSSCNTNQYVIYTDVAKFLDWIYAFMIH